MSRPVESFDDARASMVREQLIPRGIRDPAVLQVMGTIPRERFVPVELRSRAYEDNPLPIGCGQTISQPYIVARMTELLELTGREKVLEIGAGCGYQTAALALLASRVCAVELEDDLAARARFTLAELGTANLDLRCGDGFSPWPDGGRFDAILCACAPPEVPSALLSQLAPGGRLVLPVGEAHQIQRLERWTRGADDLFTRSDDGSVRFVPMRHPRSLS
jgi:protein-L-isoaspartate(D-aspartate) O-methyltransferase